MYWLFIFFESIPTTTHWLPNSSASSLIKFGLPIAGVFIEILSAPLFRISFASFKLFIPPATQKGIFITSAICLTHSFETLPS